MSNSVQLVWFKRDLRLHDHAPLHEALNTGNPVIALYADEPSVWQAPDAAYAQFLVFQESVAELAQGLGRLNIPFVYRVGEIIPILEELHDTLGISHVWSHQETGNAITYARDIAVGVWTKSQGVGWTELRQHGVERPNKGRDGWSRRWKRLMSKPMAPTPTEPQGWTPPVDLKSDPPATWEAFGKAAFDIPLRMGGGESLGLQTLHSFLHERGRNYRTDMSSPVKAFDGCSRLSHHLACGSVSLRRVYQDTIARVEELKGVEGMGGWRQSLSSFKGRLAWHCHFTQKLEDEPELEFQNMSRAFDGMRQEDPSRWTDEQRHRFESWCQGTTGMPMVDACMRAMHQGGWVNFRMRAMLMSTASYHLWLHWRPTSVFMGSQYIDLEAGIHYTQSQMQSGVTGINTARIYSPRKQVKDQDPQGVFIKRFVPELANVPPKYLPEPHLMPKSMQKSVGCIIGVDYPAPLVDESESRLLALQRLREVKRTPFAKEEAARVLQKHGSRSTRRHKHKKPAKQAPSNDAQA